MEWSSIICVQTNHYCSSSGCCLYSVGIISAAASGAARPTAITAGAGTMLASTSADPGEDKTPGTAGVGCRHLCFLSTAVVDRVIPTAAERLCKIENGWWRPRLQEWLVQGSNKYLNDGSHVVFFGT